jgi:hypothetical protein
MRFAFIPNSAQSSFGQFFNGGATIFAHFSSKLARRVLWRADLGNNRVSVPGPYPMVHALCALGCFVSYEL